MKFWWQSKVNLAFKQQQVVFGATFEVCSLKIPFNVKCDLWQDILKLIYRFRLIQQLLQPLTGNYKPHLNTILFLYLVIDLCNFSQTLYFCSCVDHAGRFNALKTKICYVREKQISHFGQLFSIHSDILLILVSNPNATNLNCRW